MKKSLIVRWIIVAVVVAVWVWALFPIHDSDYLKTFRARSAKTVQKIQKSAEQMKGNPFEVRQRLEAETDKNSETAKKLQEQLTTLMGDPHFDDFRKMRDFNELNARLTLLEQKRKYDAAQAISEKLKGLAEADGEYKLLKNQQEMAEASYADWAKTEEFKEFQKRQELALMREELKKMENPAAPAYKALAARITAEEEKFAKEEADTLAKISDAVKRYQYRQMLNRLSLILSSEKGYSGFRMLEKAANGNSSLYRLTLSDFVHIPFLGKASNKNVLRYIRVKSAGKLHLGLDLRGGTEFVLEFSEKEATGLLDQKDVQKGSYGSITEIRDRIINILENRLNSMGVTEPEIKATGDRSISVRMPSVDEADKNEIRNTIRRAAKLQFFLVSKENAALCAAYERDPENFKAPAGLIHTELEHESTTGEVSYEPIFLEARPTEVKGEDVERAFPTTNEFGQWRISLKFNAAGTTAFRNMTRENVGRQLAIVLDDKVYSAPSIREAIEGGSAEISGSFSLEEAKRLASVIASGNVPVTVVIGSEFGTDPTLGADSVRNGALAGIVGLVIVILFMLWYYKTSGFVAVCALVVNTVLVFGTMSIMKATITMPGIAGMILTIGMAVDANVIIFERIREELASGKTVGNAIIAGYGKAFTAILDSNLTTLLTCAFLYSFGTGSVKGFAVTLAFGILSSMFTAIFMCHLIFDSMYEGGWIKTLKMRAFQKMLTLRCEILKYRKFFVGISLVLVVASLATFVIRGEKMLGIDFSGGTELSYKCAGGEPNVEEVRSFLVEKGYSDNVRVGYKRGQSGEPLLEIVLPYVKVNGKEITIDYTSFNEQLDKRFPDVKISLQQTNNVGANVGSQFRSSAIKAAIFSLLGIIIYLAFRFEWMYGFGAAIAIIHDGIVSAGLYMMMGGTFSLTVVAAILTIMGYSLNDTIVIFDRIRETNHERKNLSYYQRINLAICECMSRTILTSVTTMFSVLALMIFGGGSIFDFAMVMFFGVITGTYSTIFVACSFINSWHKGRA